jgi:hypothetical protein
MVFSFYKVFQSHYNVGLYGHRHASKLLRKETYGFFRSYIPRSLEPIVMWLLSTYDERVLLCGCYPRMMNVYCYVAVILV